MRLARFQELSFSQIKLHFKSFYFLIKLVTFEASGGPDFPFLENLNGLLTQIISILSWSLTVHNATSSNLNLKTWILYNILIFLVDLDPRNGSIMPIIYFKVSVKNKKF